MSPVSKEVIVVNKTSIFKDNISVLERRFGDQYLIVLKRDNAICKVCGSNLHIVIHHKDGNCKNNKINNLICLCRSCHGDAHYVLLGFKKIPINMIFEMRKQYKTLQEIANYFGVTRQRIHQIIKRNKIPIDIDNRFR